MNNTAAEQQPWTQAQEVDAMAQMTNDLDDLSNIFNIDNFDLDSIPNLDGEFGEQLQHSSQPGTHPGTPFDEGIGGIRAPPGTVAQDFGHNAYSMPTSMGGQQQYMPLDATPPASMPYVLEPMYQPAMSQQYAPQQHPQFGYQQQYGFPGGHVPPTPNSFDMHGESGRFLQQQIDMQQRALMEQQKQMRQHEHVQFTPLASPNGTPQYPVQPEFTVPGAYFSPLTSPALHAQNAGHAQSHFQRQHQQGYYTNPSTAPSSAAPSPIDPNGDIEMGGDSMTLPEPAAQPKKSSRKKTATPRSLAMSKVKQSPIQKPYSKRKAAALSNITTPKDAESMILDGQRSGKIAPGSAGLRIPAAMESSGTDSVSPEPLTESVMGPPPRPGSTTQSPALSAQQQGSATPSGKAATPKSLLSTKSFPQSASSASSNTGENGALDDLELPAAANNEAPRRPPALAQIDTDVSAAPSEEPTPRLAARKTPKLGPSSTPASARPASASASPATAFSPMTASTPAALLKDKKQDSKGARSIKKRGSMSTSGSGMVSPALRPKISPSIKPLLPEGTNLHSPQHALLLASKSNYQNLLEGNHLPGVSYPDSLSTGLTSKRTSHKVAEQGRRNRINEALKEMQALIPSSKEAKGTPEDNGEADSPEVGADGKETKESIAKSNSSKAATVESANKYIRQLKDMDAAQKAAMLALKKENDEMKRRLEELTKLAKGSGKESPAVDSGSDDRGDAMEECKSPRAVEA